MMLNSDMDKNVTLNLNWDKFKTKLSNCLIYWLLNVYDLNLQWF